MDFIERIPSLMDDYYFICKIDQAQELRKISDELSAKGYTDNREITTALEEALNNILLLSRITKQEGVLELEEAAAGLDESGLCIKELKQLIALIVDGCDPLIVEDIAASEYYIASHTGYKALVHLIYIKGTFAIQSGEHPMVTAERLLAMLPWGIRNDIKESVMNKCHARYS